MDVKYFTGQLIVGVGEIVQAGKYRGMVKMADGTFKEVSMMDKSTFAK